MILDALTDQPIPTGGVLALGNFDGVHLGHREVIKAAAEKARASGLPARALTFEPHPYTFFQKEKKPFLLTGLETKIRLLKEAGADDVIVLPFTPEMADLSAEDFIDRILRETCAVRHVVVGFDFNFGKSRTGDASLLRKRLEPLGIDATEVPPYKDAEGKIISSSRIRKALEENRLTEANALLGRPFLLEGRIIEGDHRGRTLNMPTANMALGAYVRPFFGVYAVKARRIEGGPLLPGVANIGIRPTIGDRKEGLEFHLFGQSRSLYGELWGVELHHFLRPEEKFARLEDLQTQIQRDAKTAQSLLVGGL